uniref:Uncharacterized protein n=1 Tax=Arundo donax TaxID=35708 RepID=A0A0A9EW23_ARUDO
MFLTSEVNSIFNNWKELHIPSCTMIILCQVTFLLPGINGLRHTNQMSQETAQVLRQPPEKNEE